MLQLQHTTAPINHTRPSPHKHSPDGAASMKKQTSDYSLLLSLLTSKDEKAESTWDEACQGKAFTIGATALL